MTRPKDNAAGEASTRTSAANGGALHTATSALLEPIVAEFGDPHAVGTATLEDFGVAALASILVSVVLVLELPEMAGDATQAGDPVEGSATRSDQILDMGRETNNDSPLPLSSQRLTVARHVRSEQVSWRLTHSTYHPAETPLLSCFSSM